MFLLKKENEPVVCLALLGQVKRELAGVLIFESHAKAGTVCEYGLRG